MRKFNRVAVLMGGPSAEREVSLRSGSAVAKGLRECGYAVTEIDVRGRALDIPEGIEAAFIALHGEFGEDGEVQGLLDRLGIPYTGSGVEASRASFNKTRSKEIFAARGIPTPPCQVLRNGDPRVRSLPLPVVTKPARQGSSIGLRRVRRECEWPKALAEAFAYDPEVIVESYIEGRELTVGLVGAETLPVVEIVAPDAWYDFQAKYTSGVCRYLVPAPIEDRLRNCLQSTARRTFDALGCRGFGRVDFRASPDGGVFVLEMNTVPGFTETSLLPKAAAALDIGFSELCDRIMNLAATP